MLHKYILAVVFNEALTCSPMMCFYSLAQILGMKRVVMLLCLLAVSVFTLSAQKYVIDDNFLDSIKIYKISVADPKTGEETLGEPAFKMAMGQEVTVTRLLKGHKGYGAIKVDGREFGVQSKYLIFSDANPEGTEDIFGDTHDRVNHTWKGKFFASFTPYAIISLLFILAIAFVLLGAKSAAIRKLALYVVPGCILIASLMEVWAYKTLGTDAFWWCTMDNYGFFGSLLRAIPFCLFVAFQLYSIKLYERMLLADKNSDEKLSIKPMAISLAVCLPLTLAIVFGLAALDVNTTLRDALSVVAFFVSLGIGLFISMRKNIKILGVVAGVAFTVFGIVYILASIVAIIGLGIVLFEIILQILIICGAILGLAFVASQGGGGGGGKGTSSAAWQTSDGRWTNGKGGTYSSRHEAETH